MPWISAAVSTVLGLRARRAPQARPNRAQMDGTYRRGPLMDHMHWQATILMRNLELFRAFPKP